MVRSDATRAGPRCEYHKKMASLPQYKRDYDDILGDEIDFELVNPKLNTEYENITRVLDLDDEGCTTKKFRELRELFPTLGLWRVVFECIRTVLNSSNQIQR